MPDAKQAKRERLKALLKERFVPVVPTHLPIFGFARFGLARFATPEVMRIRELLRSRGLRRLDVNHLVNASRERCEFFVTLDKGILSRAATLRQDLAVEPVMPEEFLARWDSTNGINEVK